MTTKPANPIQEQMEHDARFRLETAAMNRAALTGELGSDSQIEAILQTLRELAVLNYELGRAIAALVKAERWQEAGEACLRARAYASDLPEVDAELVKEVIGELAQSAQRMGDARTHNACQKAAALVEQGRRALHWDGGWYVLSEDGSQWYTVLYGSCSCEAGKHGRACKHAVLAEATELAVEQAAEMEDDYEMVIEQPLAWAA